MGDSESSDLISFLKTSELFRDLSDSELTSLLNFVRIVDYKRGEWLIREGDTGQHLYTIISGKAEISKRDEETGEEQLIGMLEPGDWVGEMAHLEQEKRSASIRAIDEVEAVILLLDKLCASPLHRAIYEKISPKLTKRISQRLRITDDQLIRTLNEKLVLVQSTTQIGKTIIYTMVLFTVFFNVIAAYNNYAGSLRHIFNLFFIPSAILLFGFSAVRLIQSSGYPFEFYGITLKKWGRVALESVLWTLPLLGLMSLLKWVLISTIPTFSTLPFLALVRPDQPFSDLVAKSAFYIILVPVQELIVRGVLQSSFRNFFQGHNRVFYAILSSNLLFEVLHTGNDLFLAIFSFVFGIFWGALFEYQKSLIGVIISHILIGWWGIIALDLLSLAPTPVGP
jgi:hypothetical protein